MDSKFHVMVLYSFTTPQRYHLFSPFLLLRFSSVRQSTTDFPCNGYDGKKQENTMKVKESFSSSKATGSQSAHLRGGQQAAARTDSWPTCQTEAHPRRWKEERGENYAVWRFSPLPTLIAFLLDVHPHVRLKCGTIPWVLFMLRNAFGPSATLK